MSSAPPFHLGYRPELDGLRGLAVLAVLAYHSDLRAFLPGGFLGVDVFFVLSGFLVTVLLVQDYQRSGAFSLARFYLRRLMRLFPALLVVLAACCVYAAIWTRPDRAHGIYSAALLTACNGANADWLWSIRLDLLGHAWSLSLEEQFYLVWPLLLSLLFRFGFTPRGAAGWVVPMIATAALFRAGLWVSGSPAAIQAATTSLPARADALLAGCLVGLLACSNRLPRSGGPRKILQTLAWVSAAVLVCLGIKGQAGAAYLYFGGFAVVAAGVALVIAALIAAPPGPAARVLSNPILVWIGRISYGLYLWHFPMATFAPELMHALNPHTRKVPCLNGAAVVALTFGAAALSYCLVERPFLRWKTRVGAASRAAPFGPARLAGPTRQARRAETNKRQGSIP